MEGFAKLIDAAMDSQNRNDIESLVTEYVSTQGMPNVEDVIRAAGQHMLPPLPDGKPTANWLIEVVSTVTNRDEEEEEEEEDSLELPLPKRPREKTPVLPKKAPPKKKKAEVDIAMFLEDLKPLCEPPIAQDPDPEADTIAQYLGEMQDECSAKGEFRRIIRTGLYIRTRYEICGDNWRTIGTLLNLPGKKPQTHSRVTAALAIFHELIMMAQMYRLRHLRPTDHAMISKIVKNKNAIVHYLNEHPEEELWWSNNDEVPPLVQLTKHDGTTKEWIDKEWL